MIFGVWGDAMIFGVWGDAMIFGVWGDAMNRVSTMIQFCVRDGKGATKELCAAPKRTRSRIVEPHAQPDPVGERPNNY